MSHPDGPTGSRRAGPVQGGADRYEALLQVMEQQAERAKHQGRGRGQGGERAFRTILLLVLVAVTAWLWILPPRSLVPTRVGPEAIAREEASLRLGMYLQAQRIEAYRLEHGRLPETLTEAGEALPGMSYMLLADAVYQITGEASRLRLTYRSDQPLAEWVGPGADVLEPGPVP